MIEEKYEKFLDEIETAILDCLRSNEKMSPTVVANCFDLFLRVDFHRRAFLVKELLHKNFDTKYNSIVNKDKPTNEEIKALINLLQSEVNLIAEKDNMFSKAEDLSKTSLDATSKGCDALQGLLQNDKKEEYDNNLDFLGEKIMEENNGE